MNDAELDRLIRLPPAQFAVEVERLSEEDASRLKDIIIGKTMDVMENPTIPDYGLILMAPR